MDNIREIVIGTNNQGKYKELCDLLPHNIKKYSPKELNILSPEENGKTFKALSYKLITSRVPSLCTAPRRRGIQDSGEPPPL